MANSKKDMMLATKIGRVYINRYTYYEIVNIKQYSSKSLLAFIVNIVTFVKTLYL